MDNKKFESPEEVRAFPDSDAFANGFKKWLVNSEAVVGEVSRHLEPLVIGLQRLMEAVAPIAREFVAAVPGIKREFVKLDVSIEILGRAGWLPHYTTPFDYLAECGEDIEVVRNRLLDYYKNNWQDVRSEIEARLSDYTIDAEAKETFREALGAHESGLYRCVCRVLFPEIEHVFRAEIFNNKVGPITFYTLIKKLLDDKSIEDFMPGGLYELHIFEHLTRAICKEKDASETDKLTYGLFQSVLNEENREHLKQDPVPNRHAALHGLVAYSSPQNSLNAIFMADYIFRIVTPAVSLPSSPH